MREKNRVFSQDLLSPLGIGAKSEKQWPQKVFCYRSGDNTGRLKLEKRRDRRRSIFSLPAFLAGALCGFPRNASCLWGPG